MKTFHVQNSIVHTPGLQTVKIIEFDFDVAEDLFVKKLSGLVSEQKSNGDLDLRIDGIFTFQKLSGSSLMSTLENISFAVGAFEENKIVKRSRALNHNSKGVDLLCDAILNAGRFRVTVETNANFDGTDISYASVTMLYE